nr:MAG TPA: hypothetical protein [Caudoviricetes sp.]
MFGLQSLQQLRKVFSVLEQAFMQIKSISK